MIFVAHELPECCPATCPTGIAVMHMERSIEFGRADELFDHPAHPYTQALLAAMPSYGTAADRAHDTAGDTSADLDTHPHCRFSRRCPRALDRCQADRPRPRPEISPEHSIACFNWDNSRGRKLSTIFEPVEFMSADGVTRAANDVAPGPTGRS